MHPRFPLSCEHCDVPLGRMSRSSGNVKLHVRSRCLGVRPDGTVEMNCHHCGKVTMLPLKFAADLLTPAKLTQ